MNLFLPIVELSELIPLAFSTLPRPARWLAWRRNNVKWGWRNNNAIPHASCKDGHIARITVPRVKMRGIEIICKREWSPVHHLTQTVVNRGVAPSPSCGSSLTKRRLTASKKGCQGLTEGPGECKPALFSHLLSLHRKRRR